MRVQLKVTSSNYRYYRILHINTHPVFEENLPKTVKISLSTNHFHQVDRMKNAAEYSLVNI